MVGTARRSRPKLQAPRAVMRGGFASKMGRLGDPPLPLCSLPSPFTGQRFPLRELVNFEDTLDHRMAKKTPANHANPR